MPGGCPSRHHAAVAVRRKQLDAGRQPAGPRAPHPAPRARTSNESSLVCLSTLARSSARPTKKAPDYCRTNATQIKERRLPTHRSLE